MHVAGTSADNLRSPATSGVPVKRSQRGLTVINGKCSQNAANRSLVRGTRLLSAVRPESLVQSQYRAPCSTRLYVPANGGRAINVQLGHAADSRGASHDHHTNRPRLRPAPRRRHQGCLSVTTQSLTTQAATSPARVALSNVTNEGHDTLILVDGTPMG